MPTVATIGSIVPAGAKLDEDANAIEIKKTVVGGIASEGMLCDCPSLTWIGGAKGVLVKLDTDHEIGSTP